MTAAFSLKRNANVHAISNATMKVHQQISVYLITACHITLHTVFVCGYTEFNTLPLFQKLDIWDSNKRLLISRVLGFDLKGPETA